MMNITYTSNSLVVVATTHNPSVISESFLLKSGIIETADELSLENMIISPQFSFIEFKDGVNLQIDFGRLAISSPMSHRPYELGQKYCAALKHINGSAVGINFDLEVTDYDFESWFQKYNLDESVLCLELKFKLDNCIVAVKRMSTMLCSLNFNFHYDLDANESLGDLKLDLVQEWRKNKDIVDVFINKTF